jgi:hypothetical protein
MSQHHFQTLYLKNDNMCFGGKLFKYGFACHHEFKPKIKLLMPAEILQVAYQMKAQLISFQLVQQCIETL